MKRFLVERAIRASARRDGTDPDYILALYDTSPRALRGLGRVAALLSHREAVPVVAAFAAQLTGALEEGCGSCIQIHVNMARKAGVPDRVIEAVLSGGGEALPPDAALAARFALAISCRNGDETEAREAVRARWGARGVVDLVMATQASRFLSMLKAGLGYATACGPLSVGGRMVVPMRQAA